MKVSLLLMVVALAASRSRQTLGDRSDQKRGGRGSGRRYIGRHRGAAGVYLVEQLREQYGTRNEARAP